MTLLADGWTYVLAELATAGVNPVADPRNIQPPCTIVDLPTLRIMSGNLVQLDFPCTVIGPPPGNKDTADVLVAWADLILQALPSSTGTPSTYSVGQNELPAYTITVNLTMQRTP